MSLEAKTSHKFDSDSTTGAVSLTPKSRHCKNKIQNLLVCFFPFLFHCKPRTHQSWSVVLGQLKRVPPRQLAGGNRAPPPRQRRMCPPVARLSLDLKTRRRPTHAPPAKQYPERLWWWVGHKLLTLNVKRQNRTTDPVGGLSDS